jgi:surfeit locus 1 family protein
MRLTRPRAGLVATVSALLGLAVTLSAAWWQFDRAASKERLKADYLARRAAPELVVPGPMPPLEALRFRRIRASGVFLPAGMIYIDNRTRNGVAGYEVVVPLRPEGSQETILVNRGWIARAATRDTVPAVATPEGTVTVRGTAVVPPERVFELAQTTTEGPIWQNLVLERYRSRTGLKVADFVIQQEEAAADGLLRRWNEPGFGVERHKSYAYQWLVFAALIVVFWRILR